MVHAVEELSRAYRYSREQSRHGTVIIEEYMQGPEVSVEVMTVDGIPHILAVTDKLTTGAPYLSKWGIVNHPDYPKQQLILSRI